MSKPIFTLFMFGSVCFFLGILISFMCLETPAFTGTYDIPIRPHENDVIFEGYTIVGLVCYKCGVDFELGNGGYILGRIHCNDCYLEMK